MTVNKALQRDKVNRSCLLLLQVARQVYFAPEQRRYKRKADGIRIPCMNVFKFENMRGDTLWLCVVQRLASRIVE